MTNSNTLNELRELREVLGKASAFVAGISVLRNISGMADIAPDLELSAVSRAEPEIQEKLMEHFAKEDRWQEMQEHTEGFLADAMARLDAVVKSIGGGDEA